MNNNNRDGILLESGTNEIEIMEFTINGNLFGINVAKVREIMVSTDIRPMPHCHFAVEGIFKPRDTVLTVVNLPKYLLGTDEIKNEKDLFIITNFNKTNLAFRVNSVVGISRISWEQIQKPDDAAVGGAEGISTGIAQYDGKLVSILDFERIFSEISPEAAMKLSSVKENTAGFTSDKPIMVAEDSVLLSNLIRDALKKAGYTNITMFQNGLELWQELDFHKEKNAVQSKVSLIITDIEMPRMDGHRLIKLIKSDDELKHLPCIIFSSLISDEMRVKGKQLGADEQLGKPDIADLVDIVDRLLGEDRNRGE